MTANFRRLAGPATLALLLLLSVSAAPGASDQQPAWVTAEFPDFPVQLELGDTAALDRLLDAVPLADFNREQIRPTADGLIFTPRITAREAAALTAAGYVFTRLPDLDQAGRRAVERAWADPSAKDAAEWTAYPTHTEIGSTFATYASVYPDLCRTFSWGQSVQGRELWGLVVSADPGQTAAEPEVRLSSSMHGDEPVGMVMLMNFAEYLLLNYGQAGFEDVTTLVDNYEIHIMPLHNPDGYVAGSRVNANGVDLNRNYADPAGTHSTLQPENVAFIAYAEAQHFVISQNGHGGALVVNYPWDYTFALAPDDAAIQLLSLEYSTYNLPMYNGAFDEGITNGAEWYVATGTLQDWVYYATDCIDVTVELGNNKWPPTSQLAGLWGDNRESLMHFVKAARYGINGVVTALDTGLPLAATVTVAGNAESVTTDPAHGDYYKLLANGVYDLTFTAEGYLPQTVTGVGTLWGMPMVVDVVLEPDPSTVPPALRLALQAVPNPFNPQTRLDFTVPVDGRATLAVYDVQGRLVRVLEKGTLTAGDHHRLWDGCSDTGRPVPSAVYFARLVTRDGVRSTKLMLVK